MALSDILVPAFLHLVLLHVVHVLHLCNQNLNDDFIFFVENKLISLRTTLVMHQEPSGPGVAVEKSTIPEKSGFSGSFGPGWATVVASKANSGRDCGVIKRNLARLLQLPDVWGRVCSGVG